MVELEEIQSREKNNEYTVSVILDVVRASVSHSNYVKTARVGSLMDLAIFFGEIGYSEILRNFTDEQILSICSQIFFAIVLGDEALKSFRNLKNPSILHISTMSVVVEEKENGCVYKYLRPYGSSANEAEIRFRREVNYLRQLTRERVRGVVSIIGHNFDDEVPYFSCEFIDGKTLDEYKVGENFSINEMILLMMKLLGILKILHDKNLLHRDLKPENIIIDKEMNPHIIDLGLAINVETDNRNLLYNHIVGTLGYIAPEVLVCRFNEIGPQSDIYALGIIMYQLCLGKMPYEEKDYYELYCKIISGEVPKIDHLQPKLSAIIKKAMANSVEDRYSNVDEMQKDLLAALIEYIRINLFGMASISDKGDFYLYEKFGIGEISDSHFYLLKEERVEEIEKTNFYKMLEVLSRVESLHCSPDLDSILSVEGYPYGFWMKNFPSEFISINEVSLNKGNLRKNLALFWRIANIVGEIHRCGVVQNGITLDNLYLAEVVQSEVPIYDIRQIKFADWENASIVDEDCVTEFAGDLRDIGALMFEFLTQNSPYKKDDELLSEEVMEEILQSSDVNDDLSSIILKAMRSGQSNANMDDDKCGYHDAIEICSDLRMIYSKVVAADREG